MKKALAMTILTTKIEETPVKACSWKAIACMLYLLYGFILSSLRVYPEQKAIPSLPSGEALKLNYHIILKGNLF